MAPTVQEAAEAIEWYARAECDWQDEYEDMTLDYLSLAELKRIIDACTVHKINLTNCYFTVSKCDAATQSRVKSLDDVQTLKKSYIAFIAKCWQQDHNTRKESRPDDRPIQTILSSDNILAIKHVYLRVGTCLSYSNKLHLTILQPFHTLTR
jgi:hypothetical protein